MSPVPEHQRVAIERWAQGEWRVRRVILFGSRVKGTNRIDSDLDVAVEVEPREDASATLQSYWDHSPRWKAQLESLLDLEIDLEWYDPSGSTQTIQNGINEASYIVYEKAS